MTAPFTWSEGRINTAYDGASVQSVCGTYGRSSADDRLAAPIWEPRGSAHVLRLSCQVRNVTQAPYVAH